MIRNNTGDSNITSSKTPIKAPSCNQTGVLNGKTISHASNTTYDINSSNSTKQAKPLLNRQLYHVSLYANGDMLPDLKDGAS